jgi:4-hydroxybenzoate polyprenyltransferase
MRSVRWCTWRLGPLRRPLPLSCNRVIFTGTTAKYDVEKTTKRGPNPTALGPLDPYFRLARLDKPIGTTLLLWPCMWSIAMAAPTGCLPDLATMGLFSVGAVVMRGAGCTINDYWDRDIDGHVTRTAARPIANGEVSPTAALAFFAAQCVTGLGVLLQLPPQTLVLGAASLPLVVAYPLAKRYTKYPQFVLGLTFNWGAMLGWAAVRNGARNGQALQLDAGRGVTTASGSAGECGAGSGTDTGLGAVTTIMDGSGGGGVGDRAVITLGEVATLYAELACEAPFTSGEFFTVLLPLYGGAVCWTLVYDTLYAHQDKTDDRRLGLHSTALTFGDAGTKPVLFGFSFLALGGIAMAGHGAGLAGAWPFYAGLGTGAAQLAWQVGGADLEDPKDLWRRFVSNNW